MKFKIGNEFSNFEYKGMKFGLAKKDLYYLESATSKRRIRMYLAKGAVTKVTGDMVDIIPAVTLPRRSDTLNTAMRMTTVQEPRLQEVIRVSTPGYKVKVTM